MPQDSPTLIDALQHIDFENDSILEITLKGHLVLEAQIDQILRQHFPSAEYYDDARLSFAQKLALIRARHWRLQDHDIWKLVQSLNKLRNTYSHKLDQGLLEQRLQDVLRMQLHISESPEETSGILKGDDRTQLIFAFIHIQGFLGRYLDDAVFLAGLLQALHSTDPNHARSGQGTDGNPH
jgi:hypothetical protein